jgi:hypothetical protein
MFEVEVLGDFFHEAKGVEVVFSGVGSLEFPEGSDVEGGEGVFEGSVDVEFRPELFGEGVVGFAVFVGEDGDVAGESVAASVEGAALFAGFGFGARGFLGVGAVGFNLFCGWHDFSLD